jgi:hypothetical protein
LIGRLKGIGNRGQSALVSLAVAIGFGATATGCQQGGDSSASSVPDDSSSSPSDATIEAETESGAAPPNTFVDSGIAAAVYSPTTLNFPAVPCGGPPATQLLHVSNTGTAPLAIAAKMTGTGYAVTPGALRVNPGTADVFSVTATAPSSGSPGVPFMGALNLFTNDPSGATVVVPLVGDATGATLAFLSASTKGFAFPSTKVGTVSSLTLNLINGGNGPATFTFGAPSDKRFTLATSGDDAGAGTVTLSPGATWTGAATFAPMDTSPVTATSTITATGITCGTGVQSLSFSGQGSVGNVIGWPNTVDFGPADCGGASPPEQSFTVTNTGQADARITSLTLTGTPGFATSAKVGRSIAGNNGEIVVTVDAPPVPAFSPMTPITATLTVQTDADTSPHVITLTEEPNGAVLAFDTSATPNFGNFGSVVLLGSAMQSFNVANTGTASATVVLIEADGNQNDGGIGDAGAGDATVADAGATSAFSVSSARFSLLSHSTQPENVTFAPQSGLPATGSIALVAGGPICGQLPSPLLLSGTGLGGGPTIAPTSLVFTPTCGGSPPAPQALLLSNQGNTNLTWMMSAVAGTGAALYTVSASPPPGSLIPGAASTLTVTAAAVASPAPTVDPSAYAAQITITTDVPLDPPHVVSLTEAPLGDQLSWSLASPLRFGQIPVHSTLGQTFTIANTANAGSQPAVLAFALSGQGAAAYSVMPPTVSSLAPGGAVSGSESIVFAPMSATSSPATLALSTTDSLCTALPPPIQLVGTGTAAGVSVSATSVAFGTDPADPVGLVNCGATGVARTVTVANVGNRAFNVTGVALGRGATSPYQFNVPLLPASVPIGGSIAIALSASAIPANADPNDPSLFSDTLTVTTDADQDMPHTIHLVMQARGAVVADTPLQTTWTFGTISYGSIGTFTSGIKNTGNASVSVALNGLGQPGIFALANNPTKATANGVTALVGEFSPPSSNGSWQDQGTLVVTADQVFCAPLPQQWSAPTIQLSGASSDSPSVTVSGALAFANTNCGSSSPAGQTVILKNATNVGYPYTLQFNAGKYYTWNVASGSADAGGGVVPANGVAQIVVTPNQVTPGPGVVTGSTPYADDLLVSVATTPPTKFTIPVSWSLSGAVLSLPQSAGPDTDSLGNAYYAADSTSGFPLPMINNGNATATVGFLPSGLFALSPKPPIQVVPGILASPELSSTGSNPTCPARTKGSATFVYSGPVCQPFPSPSVVVEACAGSL